MAPDGFERAQAEAGVTPRIDFSGRLGTLCPRWTPLKLTGAFVEVLRGHFANAANVEEPALRELTWTDAPDTRIVIEEAWRFKPETTGGRPAVLVKRGRIEPIPSNAIAAGKYIGCANAGVSRHSYFFQGSVVCMCLAGEAGEADILAGEVQRQLLEFSQVIRARLNLMRVAILGVDEVGKLEEYNENFAVPVGVAFGYAEEWATKAMDAARLRRLDVALGLTTA